ncbi:hypothetical protein BC669P2_00021 [Bacteroides phage BC669P2]|nr:hypothetical protein BC669P2_00021 [Bacteroides phage BC669P2]
MEKEKFTSEYQVGDTVVLGDNEKFVYKGSQFDGKYRCNVHLYEPVQGTSKEFASASNDMVQRLLIPSNFVPFSHKVLVPENSINAPVSPAGWAWTFHKGEKRSFTSKLFGWFLESNRWKHFLYAIPAGAINFWLAIGLALGMEFKDAQGGGKFDWVDATCTAVGGFVGAALSWWLLGNYVLHYLIKLIF